MRDAVVMRSMLGLGLGLILGACGDAAVDGNYRGEALFTLTGTVDMDIGTATITDSGELRAALFWAKPTSSTDTSVFDTVTAVEQELGAASAFPARYTLTIRHAPPATLIGTAADVQGGFATALVLVYLDVNGDGRWNHATEALVGSAQSSVVVYAPNGLTGGRYGVLAPGFHLLADPTGLSPCDGTLAQADAANLKILVDMQYPGQALADINCDGGPSEWLGACPKIDHIVRDCRDPNGIREPEMCAVCDALLWPVNADQAACDAWLTTCQTFEDLHECEEAWEHCANTEPFCEFGDDCN